MSDSRPAWILDYANMLTPALADGAPDAAMLAGPYQERHRAALAHLDTLRESGSLGFLELPTANDDKTRVQELADGFGQWFRTVVVLGIGGSALGTQTLRDALRGPHWNELTDEQREHFPKLYVLDNPDPATVLALLDRIDLRTTLFNVVSKSGSTAETAALYLVVRERLREALDDPEAVRGHLLFTTDPDHGALRALAQAEEIPTLPVPANVGGRFSVLSPVGLLPAAVLGVDVDALLAGAQAMAEHCSAERLTENPAGLLAALLHAADAEHGRSIHVLMPYADRLRSFALWFQQLWAESLGKVGPGGVGVGPTPLPAVGAVDQHAQVQLFMEGPADKVVLFMAVADRGAEASIPSLHAEVDAFDYLAGHTLGSLLAFERRATAEALRQRGRANATIELARIDAYTLGGLFMLFEIATVLAGAHYGVDPLVQPGVELGKTLTYGLMGRDGYPEPELPSADPAFRVARS